jgi:cytochrome c553
MAKNVKLLCCAVLLLALLWCRAAWASEPVPAIVEKVCSTCHGMDGNSVIPTIPKLAGRHPDYLFKELSDFVSGKRTSEVMGAIAPTIELGELRKISAYFGAQKSTSEAITDPIAAALGEQIFLNGDEARGLPACGGCHEDDGSGGKRFPRLAGQHRAYLIEQLHKFRTGVHLYPGARFMREVAKRMTEEEIRAVAEYVSAK